MNSTPVDQATCNTVRKHCSQRLGDTFPAGSDCVHPRFRANAAAFGSWCSGAMTLCWISAAGMHASFDANITHGLATEALLPLPRPQPVVLGQSRARSSNRTSLSIAIVLRSIATSFALSVALRKTLSTQPLACDALRLTNKGLGVNLEDVRATFQVGQAEFDLAVQT